MNRGTVDLAGITKRNTMQQKIVAISLEWPEMSMEAIARLVGRSACHVADIRRLHGIHLPSRPEKWTEEAVEQLKALWAEGIPAPQIGARLGGATKNAVIGKVHRLGLPRRPPNYNRKPPTEQQKTFNGYAGTPRSRRARSKKRAAGPGRSTPKPPPKASGPAPDNSNPISLTELTGRTCRYPLGDPRAEGFGFCGEPTRRASDPYCPYHMEIAFIESHSKHQATK